MSVDDQVKSWLRDYVAMMRANLGAISHSRIEGLYDDFVDRILEIESLLRSQDSAGEKHGG